MIDITRNPKDIVKKALLSEVEILLSECTGPQQTQFMRFFPTWPDLSEEQLFNAIGLCQRTIRKNRKNQGED